MPEYIEREALIAKFEELGLGKNSIIEKHFANGVYAVIETFPAADVAEVVRCKNCKHRYELLCCYGEYDYGFCNYGERKEQTDE